MDTETRAQEKPETAPNTAQKNQSAFIFGAVDPPSTNTTSRRGAERGHARQHNPRTPRGRARATTASSSTTEGDTQGTTSPIEPGLFVNTSTLKSDEYMHLCAEINKLKRDIVYMKKTMYTANAAAGNTQAPAPAPTPTPVISATATTATTATTTSSPPTKAHHARHAVSFVHSEAPDPSLPLAAQSSVEI